MGGVGGGVGGFYSLHYSNSPSDTVLIPAYLPGTLKRGMGAESLVRTHVLCITLYHQPFVYLSLKSYIRYLLCINKL